MRAWLFGLALTMSGCATPAPLRCTGPTGFASDRAHEMVLHGEGETTAVASADIREAVTVAAIARLRTLDASSTPRGAPLFPDFAQVVPTILSTTDSGPNRSIRYRMDVTTFGRDDAHAATYPYPAADGVTYDDTGRALLGETPPWLLLGDERVIRVGAMFGQMTEAELTPDDGGFWSVGALVKELVSRGFTPSGGVYRSGRVEVEIIAPHLAPIFDEITRDRARDLIARSDVVYLNGHAETRLTESLSLPASWTPAKPRLVFVDACSSYYFESTRAQLVSGSTHLVVTDGRTLTGSVGSFLPIIDALRSPGRAETWKTLLVQMNDLAVTRAEERRGKVGAKYEVPEVYGVVPPRPVSE